MGLGPTASTAFATCSTADSRGGLTVAGPGLLEIFTGSTVKITDDVQRTLDKMRPLTAMYVGGMGSETHNFHRDGDGAARVPRRGRPHQRTVASRSQEEAVAAVPDEYLEQGALIGSVDASANVGT